jgi:hypothetical protein
MGQAVLPADDDGVTPAVEAFVERARGLSDDELRAVADARDRVDEAFHAAALRAASEALRGRGHDYVRARNRLSAAHVPAAAGDAVGEDRAEWQRVSRLAQLAIDDALLALVTSDVIHPKHVRELYRSFGALSS